MLTLHIVYGVLFVRAAEFFGSKTTNWFLKSCNENMQDIIVSLYKKIDLTSAKYCLAFKKQ